MEENESRAARRDRLHAEFLEAAERVLRLLNAVPVPATANGEEILRWQAVYAEPEGRQVRDWYEEITRPGSRPSSETLEDWLVHVRKLLENAPNEQG